jgi:excisionase family DNA binding protein
MVRLHAPRYCAGMNHDPKEPLTIAVTGNLTITHDQLENLIQHLPTTGPEPVTPPQARTLKLPEAGGRLPRLAYTVKETAEILGISPPTVYRLLCRGLLRSSLALRHKIIARSEIERFLKDTSREV